MVELRDIYEITEAIVSESNPKKRQAIFDQAYYADSINTIRLVENGQRVSYTAYSFPKSGISVTPKVAQFLLNVAATGDLVWTNTQVESVDKDYRQESNIFVLKRAL